MARQWQLATDDRRSRGRFSPQLGTAQVAAATSEASGHQERCSTRAAEMPSSGLEVVNVVRSANQAAARTRPKLASTILTSREARSDDLGGTRVDGPVPAYRTRHSRGGQQQHRSGDLGRVDQGVGVHPGLLRHARHQRVAVDAQACRHRGTVQRSRPAVPHPRRWPGSGSADPPRWCPGRRWPGTTEAGLIPSVRTAAGPRPRPVGGPHVVHDHRDRRGEEDQL